MTAKTVIAVIARSAKRDEATSPPVIAKPAVIARSAATKQPLSITTKQPPGFTFIEVLVAMLIFTMAALASMSIVQGSVRATRESKEIAEATWLLQNLMSNTESKLEALGIDRACKEKDSGKFNPPHEAFTWKTECYKIDFNLSESATKLAKQMSGDKDSKDDKDDEKSQQQNQMLKMVLQIASEYLTRSSREIHAEVNWVSGKTPRQVAANSHFVRYDQQVALPASLGALLGGGAPPSTNPAPSGAPTH